MKQPQPPHSGIKKPDPAKRSNARRRAPAILHRKTLSLERTAIAKVFTSAVYDGHYYGVRFPWNPDLQKVLKEQFKAFWMGDATSPYHKSWVFAKQFVEESPRLLAEALKAAGVEAKPADFANWLLEESVHDRFAFTRGVQVKIFTLKEGGFVFKTSRYHLSFPAFQRAAGGTYLHRVQAWRFPTEANLPLLVGEMQAACALEPNQLELVPGVFLLESEATRGLQDVKLDLGDCLDEVPGEKNPWQDAFADNSTILLPEMLEYQQEVVDEGVLRERIDKLPLLLDFQRDCAAFMAARPGAGNFSEQGTGKTFVSIAAAHAVEPEATARKLVVCPVNKIFDWRDEILRLLPDATISVDEPSREAEWVILPITRLKLIQHGWESYFRLLLVDEAHQMKESATDRTQELLQIAQTIPRAYVLTGTPIPNRELELWTLLRISRHPLGALSMEEFQDRFCGSPEARARLAAAIRPWFVRVMKLDVLSLPPKHRTKVMLEPTEEFAAAYNAITNSNVKGMNRVHKYCMLLEQFKMDWLMKQIEQLPVDEKAIVFTAYNATLEDLEAAHKARGIGFIKALASAQDSKRHANVTSFREDESLKVYGGTILGNGTGLNLQRGNHAYVLTLPWTAANLHQAEDREHRFGQTRPVYINIPLVARTIDEAMYELVDYKAALAESVLSPEDAAKRNQEAIIKVAERPRLLTVQKPPE